MIILPVSEWWYLDGVNGVDETDKIWKWQDLKTTMTKKTSKELLDEGLKVAETGKPHGRK